MFYEGYDYAEIISVCLDVKDRKAIVVGSVVTVKEDAGYEFPDLRGSKCVVSSIRHGLASLKIDGEPYRYKLKIKEELQLWEEN